MDVRKNDFLANHFVIFVRLTVYTLIGYDKFKYN
ncbi:hypothetical protein HMPREF1015_03195 [Bacillus smithii 7_3_47FAA]|uniref:Uncharacterized protein n=1 Tax=Bacillus smithii 7_3_47FAA TaxID=665952 RepID=G9QNW0_9BACI|nr:hypothetical protein HMPREF1015_03195 [Bacillus smithii 7_3_47FAA]